MDLSQNFFPKGEAVIAVSSSYMWCFIFMERKRASNFRAVLPGRKQGKTKTSSHIITTLNCNVPSLFIQSQHIQFLKKTQAGIQGNIFYHGLNGIGYAPVRGVVSGAVKDVVSISYVCLWDFLIHRKSFLLKSGSV